MSETSAPARRACMKCEANDCTKEIPGKSLIKDDEIQHTRWFVPVGWLVRYVHIPEVNNIPEHERLVVLCPDHGGYLVK